MNASKPTVWRRLARERWGGQRNGEGQCERLSCQRDQARWPTQAVAGTMRVRLALSNQRPLRTFTAAAIVLTTTSVRR